MLSSVSAIFALWIILSFCLCLIHCDEDKTQTLQLVTAIFRHGERTKDVGPTYPKDPYSSETYHPFGFGELTNKGKKTSYNLGQTLRKLYDSFLGPLYVPGLIDPVATNYSRAKCTLQLFLAGLFAPSDTVLQWSTQLNWNPIPYKEIGSRRECPKYKQLYQAYIKTAEVLAVDDKYKSMYSYISQETGLNVTSIFGLSGLYVTLLIQEEWGYELPSWSRAVYPDYLRNAAIARYQFLVATPQLNQLFGGFLLKEIISDMRKTINSVQKQPKMHILSGHDIQIIGLLGALDLFEPHFPDCGACLIIELHKVKEEYYVVVRYSKNAKHKFMELKIPRCKTMCPFEDFVNLLKKHIPEGDHLCDVNRTDS